MLAAGAHEELELELNLSARPKKAATHAKPKKTAKGGTSVDGMAAIDPCELCASDCAAIPSGTHE